MKAATQFPLNMEGRAPESVSRQQAGAIRKTLADLFGTPDEPKIPSGVAFSADLVWRAASPITGAPEGQERGLFRRHCVTCHGIPGDGAGPTATAMTPSPRDFRSGTFKYTSTRGGAKPTLADLRRTLHRGLAGTAMPSFGHLPKEELDALLEYVKYLSIRGQTETYLFQSVVDEDGPLPPDEAQVIEEGVLSAAQSWLEPERRRKELVVEPLPPRPPVSTPDQRAASVAMGRELYLSTSAQCAKCHGPEGTGEGERNELYDDWNLRKKGDTPEQTAELARLFTLRIQRPRARRLHRLSLATAILVYVQIVLGAQLRHLIPHQSPGWFVLWVWLHLIVAGLLAAAVVWLLGLAGRRFADERTLVHGARWLAAALVAQLALGAATWVTNYGWPAWFTGFVWAIPYTAVAGGRVQALSTTAHVAVGSLALAAALCLTLWSRRLAADRPLLRGRERKPQDPLPAGAVHAVRECALRAGLPRGGHLAQRRGAQRHGLQPLRRHPLLLEQLPVQGAAIQFPSIRRLWHRGPEADAQPQRHGPQPRGDGEVYLLRAADYRGPHPGGQGSEQRTSSCDPRRRDRNGLPGGVPGRGHCVRRLERSGKPSLQVESDGAQLRVAGGAERAVPQLLWSNHVRSSPWILFPIALLINLGMWTERYVIVIVSLHRDFLPSSWGMYHATQWDWMTLAGSIGLFLCLFILFIRFLPMISMSEMRKLTTELKGRSP